MAAIDLVLLGMLLEKPQSAYDLQKDVAYHHLPRWTRISVPSVYKRVLRMREEGWLDSEAVPGQRLADKAVYTVTPAGRAHFAELMAEAAAQPIGFPFDLNVVIVNLNRLPPAQGRELLAQIRRQLTAAAEETDRAARMYADIPPAGRAIFAQQQALYAALSSWLDDFIRDFEARTAAPPPGAE